MNTSPSGPRWIALGGQSAMQCGCSQWRQTGRHVEMGIGLARPRGRAATGLHGCRRRPFRNCRSRRTASRRSAARRSPRRCRCRPGTARSANTCRPRRRSSSLRLSMKALISLPRGHVVRAPSRSSCGLARRAARANASPGRRITSDLIAALHRRGALRRRRSAPFRRHRSRRADRRGTPACRRSSFSTIIEPRRMTIDVLALVALGRSPPRPARTSSTSAVSTSSATIVAGQARAEHLQQLPLDRDAVDRARGARHRGHQLQRGGARHLDARCGLGRRGSSRRAGGPRSARPRRRSSPARSAP